MSPIADVSESVPGSDQGPGRTAKFYRGQPGFELRAWNGGTVFTSWLYTRVHIVRDGRRQGSWADLLHAVRSPCFVVPNEPGPLGEPRLALYRLRVGERYTFRVAVIQQEDEGLFRAVTAFSKASLANGHYQAILDAPPPTCDGFALRRRDLHPPDAGRAVPVRWSTAARVPPSGCCELDPGCTGPSGSPVGDA